MTNLSRTKKYKELRERLQSDTDSDRIGSDDLSRFERKLNQIDANNFSAPKPVAESEFRSAHARDLYSKPVQTESLRRTQSEKLSPSFDTASYHRNENDTLSFDNDYLDQYIKEVKQYNIDQGNAASENTQVNILRQIERNKKDLDIPTRPFPRDTSRRDPFQQSDFNSRSAQTAKTETYSMPQSQLDAQQVTELFKQVNDETNQRAMTKEDIMAEVQNLVNGNNDAYTLQNVDRMMQEEKEDTDQYSDTIESPFLKPRSSSKTDTMGTDTFSRHIQADRTTRQQLLNETAQMRAQLDDYEDNLSEVSDKMRHTNKILNIVLVVLIVALAIILGIVIYWIVISK